MHLFFHSAVVVAAVDTDVVVAELYASKQILAAWDICQQLLHEDLHIRRIFPLSLCILLPNGRFLRSEGRLIERHRPAVCPSFRYLLHCNTR